MELSTPRDIEVNSITATANANHNITPLKNKKFALAVPSFTQSENRMGLNAMDKTIPKQIMDHFLIFDASLDCVLSNVSIKMTSCTVRFFEYRNTR